MKSFFSILVFCCLALVCIGQVEDEILSKIEAVGFTGVKTVKYADNGSIYIHIVSLKTNLKRIVFLIGELI